MIFYFYSWRTSLSETESYITESSPDQGEGTMEPMNYDEILEVETEAEEPLGDEYVHVFAEWGLYIYFDIVNCINCFLSTCFLMLWNYDFVVNYVLNKMCWINWFSFECNKWILNGLIFLNLRMGHASWKNQECQFELIKW